MMLGVGNVDKVFYHAILYVIVCSEMNKYHDIVHFLEIE